MILNPNDLREKMIAIMNEEYARIVRWRSEAFAAVADAILALPELQQIAHSASQMQPVSERERVLVEAADTAQATINVMLTLHASGGERCGLANRSR